MPFVKVNGYRLHYADDDFVDLWRPHDVILMQHFVFGNHTQFQQWVPILSKEFRVLRMDRRGSGLSSKPTFNYEFTLEDLMSDFVGFLDALSIDRVHYIGDSLGGVLGAAFAALHPERVKSLLLCATPCWIKPETSRNFPRDGYKDGPSAVMAMGSWAYSMTGQLRYRKADVSVWDELKIIERAEQMAQTPAHVIASLIRMVTQRSFDITPLLEQIRAPTMLLSPDSSPHAPESEQSMMLERISDCKQVMFQGAAHSISTDQPERCAEEALKFIRDHNDI